MITIEHGKVTFIVDDGIEVTEWTDDTYHCPELATGEVSVAEYWYAIGLDPPNYPIPSTMGNVEYRSEGVSIQEADVNGGFVASWFYNEDRTVTKMLYEDGWYYYPA